MRLTARLLLAACAAAVLGLSAVSEPLGWLIGYLRIDTSNPPGHEQRAAAYLAAILHREGIPTRLYVSPEGRVSLLARLAATHPDASEAGSGPAHPPASGTGPGPHPPASGTGPDATSVGDGPVSDGDPGGRGSLVLLHHMDTVPAVEAEWALDPWAAVVHEGALWGRGTLDDKGMGVTHLAAFLELKRRRVPLTREVVFLATADEETGGGQGLAWLLDAEPDLVAQTGAVLTEGGTGRGQDDTPLWWGIEVAQKRPLWLELTARGRGGHGASASRHGATALLVGALARAQERPPQPRVTPAAARYLRALAPLHGAGLADAAADLPAAGREGRFPRRIPPGMAGLFLDTLQITVLEAGDRTNVLPAEARARLDVRLLPDTDQQAFLAELRAALGPEVEIEVLLDAPRVAASPTAHWAYRCVGGVLAESAPVVPAFVSGVTDARTFRQRGVPAYGVWPFALTGTDMQGVHGIDERIPVAAFERGVERMVEIVRRCATA